MVSVASGGTADRIAARIFFKVLRAGSGTPARYSSTFLGGLLRSAAELRPPDFRLFMRAMLWERPVEIQLDRQGQSGVRRARREYRIQGLKKSMLQRMALIRAFMRELRREECSQCR